MVLSISEDGELRLSAMRRCRSRDFNVDALSTMLCHPENRGKGRWLPGKEWGVWMERELNGVGSSHPSTITSDPTSQAGVKLEV